MIKKSLLAAAFAAVFATSAMAGGLLTNTNQNAAFLRNFAQEGRIDITTIYANPAASAFLNNGWHLSLNSQTAFQERNVETTFPLFALNLEDPNPTHKFKGTATAPVIPSFTVAYTRDKWSLSAHFGLTGGGGKCEFAQGLGSFEAMYAGAMYQMVPGIIKAQAPSAIAQVLINTYHFPEDVAAAQAAALANLGTYNMTGYKMNKFMKGTSYNFGLQLGGTYKVLDNLALYGGVRIVYATTNYRGHVMNLEAGYAYSIPNPMDPANPIVGGDISPVDGYDLELDCDQSDWSATPILGLDWKINDQWNVSAKYEFKTKMRLKNSTTMSDFAKQACMKVLPDGTPNPLYSETLANYQDGGTVKDDIPGILAIGVEYKPIKTLALSAGYHWYQDSDATKNGNKHNYVNDSHEILAGAEWRCCNWLSVSGSWQKTMYDMKDEFMNDVSFNNSSNSLGVGFRVHASQKVNIDLGYMHTFYKDKTVANASTGKIDTYSRNNNVFGLGVNIDF